MIEHYLQFDGDKMSLRSIEDKKKKRAEAYSKVKLLNGFDHVRQGNEQALRLYLQTHDVNQQAWVSKNTLLHVAVQSKNLAMVR